MSEVLSPRAALRAAITQDMELLSQKGPYPGPRLLTSSLAFFFLSFLFLLFSAGVGPWQRPEDPAAVPVWRGCAGPYRAVLCRPGSHVKS